MTALHTAAKRGNVPMVKCLISRHADMEAKDSEIMTALHYACEEGHFGVVELLLDRKMDVNIRGFDRRTPLICAAATGRLPVVQLLLHRTASRRHADDGGMSALHWAAFNGHVEVVDLLGQKKGLLGTSNSIGRMPLHLAVLNSQFATVELILRKESPTEARCHAGFTALHYACMWKDCEITRLLLTAGSDIEAPADTDQKRPIHLAANSNSVELLTLLCDKGASLDARDAKGDRALGTACRNGCVGAAQLLLDRGSRPLDASGSEQYRDSPVCLATKGGHLSIVSLLLQYDPSVVRKDEFRSQLIRYAAHYGHPEILQLLIAYVPVPARTGAAVGLSAEHIGFAPDANISLKQKTDVRRILDQAFENPSQPPEDFSYRNSPSMRMTSTPRPQMQQSDLPSPAQLQPENPSQPPEGLSYRNSPSMWMTSTPRPQLQRSDLPSPAQAQPLESGAISRRASHFPVVRERPNSRLESVRETRSRPAIPRVHDAIRDLQSTDLSANAPANVQRGRESLHSTLHSDMRVAVEHMADMPTRPRSRLVTELEAPISELDSGFDSGLYHELPG